MNISLAGNYMEFWKHLIAQRDEMCSFCEEDIPKGDWAWDNEDDEIMCSNCAEKKTAQAEAQMDEES